MREGGPPILSARSFGRALLYAAGVLLMAAGDSLAIDPPPSYILAAPPDRQLHYANEIGARSEKERAQVAAVRFAQRQKNREELTAGLAAEMQAQVEDMRTQSGNDPFSGGASKSPAPADSTEEDPLPFQPSLALWGAVILVLACFRKQLMQWCGGAAEISIDFEASPAPSPTAAATRQTAPVPPPPPPPPPPKAPPVVRRGGTIVVVKTPPTSPRKT